MDPSARNLALIVGHYKAGSTWLLRLLSLHPQVRGVAETHIFHHVTSSPDLATCTEILFTGVPWSAGGLRQWPLHRLQRLGQRIIRKGSGRFPSAERPSTLLDLGWIEGRTLRRDLLRCESAMDYCRLFFTRLQALLQPQSYLLEKTPRNIRYVPLIREIFPSAKLIAIHRDGRDVCVSDRFFRAQRGESWSLEDSVNRWREAMDLQRQYSAKYGLYALGYESLQSEPEVTVVDLLRFLGLSAEPDLVRNLVRRSSFELVTGRNRGAEKTSSFNRKGIVGDWRNHFTPRDKEDFKSLANDLLVELEYERDSDW